MAATDGAGLDETRACLARIAERGFERERDLLADLERLLEELA